MAARIRGGSVTGSGESDGLANTNSSGQQRTNTSQPEERECDIIVAGASDLGAPNPLGGFWADAIWIPCSDGKARPIGPGLAVLATGVTGRMGKLRALGNALCAPVATEFIKAVMECVP